MSVRGVFRCFECSDHSVFFFVATGCSNKVFRRPLGRQLQTVLGSSSAGFSSTSTLPAASFYGQVWFSHVRALIEFCTNVTEFKTGTVNYIVIQVGGSTHFAEQGTDWVLHCGGVCCGVQ